MASIEIPESPIVFAGYGIVAPEYGWDDYKGLDVKGKAVLVHTGWDAHWRTDEYSAGGHPFLTRAVAEHLAQAGAALVGIDSLNIDDHKDGTRPVHTTLLFFAYASFFIAFSAGVMYLLQERELRLKKFSAIFHRLPSLTTVDDVGSTAASVGLTVSSSSIRPIRTAPTGPRNGSGETISAADAPLMHRMS